MGRLRNISRREFIAGVAVTGAAFGMAPARALQEGLSLPETLWTYPPARTGLRGAHIGSFEVAHGVAWAGERYDRPKDPVDRPYDLVIVGGGISGLASALLAREKLGRKARILILDNHDDFGGHAKRNEFTVGGKGLIGYGGSQSLEAPGQYSKVSKAFIKSLGIETERFYRYFDQSFYERQGLGMGLYLDKATYGADRLLVGRGVVESGGLWNWETDAGKAIVAKLVADLPLPDGERAALMRLLMDRPDWLAGMDRGEKIDWLRRTSFEACLKERAGLGDAALAILRNEVVGYWGIGWDALSGLEAVRLYHPLTAGLGLDPETVPKPYEGDEPYIFHFPDGNASVARLALARLVPDAVPGVDGMDSIVGATVHYDRLDKAENPVRVRLMSTAVDARNTKTGVEVTYVRDGKVERVEARHAIMACWNHMLPHIMPDLQDAQKDALQYAEKVPLTYINVALNNWKPFKKAGIAHLYAPSALCVNASLDFPVSMGGYTFARTPDDPILLHMTHVPTSPGLPSRAQHRAGRHAMYAMSFDDYEQAILAELTGALGSHGFDPEAHIAAITVNRWPHGYAYEYNELWDPLDYTHDAGPHVTGRATIGRIAIANSDSSAYAFVDGAVDAAARAVKALWG